MKNNNLVRVDLFEETKIAACRQFSWENFRVKLFYEKGHPNRYIAENKYFRLYFGKKEVHDKK